MLVPDDVKRSKFSKYEWTGSIDVFNQIIEWLYVNNYKTINTEDFYYWYKGKTEYDPKTVLITFDDGYYDVYYLVYPILKKYNFKATCFIIGSKIKKKTPKYDKNKSGYIGEDVIDKIRKEYPNLEFQSHSYNMHYSTNICNPRIKCMNDYELEIDILKNSKYGFTTFSYPYGKFNNKIQMLLKKKGYLCAFRFGPSGYATRNSVQYAIPRIKINGLVNKNYAIKWIQNGNLN
jgi:peptidoglycan/xylan/chitin deacetylase (PgdA/CDA1 family)